MALVDCHADIVSYHDDEVTLPKAEQDEMRSRRDAGRTRLRTGLDKDKKPKPSEIATQGSYAMRTMVQDPESDYDIDDGVYFSKADLTTNGVSLTPLQAREMVWHALQHDERLKNEAKVKDNCVRQLYPQGYHIDMPVYRDNGSGQSRYELASKNTWAPADGRAVTAWFTQIVGQLNTGERDGNQLRRVVRLTKKYARSRMIWKKSMTSGLCVTKLVADHFVAQKERDDDALLAAWKAIHQKLKTSLRIEHPAISGTTASKGDNDAEVAFLRDKLGEALTTLAPLESSGCTKDSALACWDKVFNTSYFSRRGPKGGTGGKGGPPFVKTSGNIPSRDDGDRRFGW